MRRDEIGLRELRRRAGMHQRLDQRELVDDLRVCLPEFRVRHCERALWRLA